MLCPKSTKVWSLPQDVPLYQNSLTENASCIIDEYLYSHVKGLFSHVKDTIELLKIIEGLQVPTGAWLVAIDIEALYNSTPHIWGIQVVCEFLGKRDLNSRNYN